MAFDVGAGAAKVRPTMNVTPLVDVVLVLLIIFMVITPLLAKSFWLHVPAKDDKAQAEPPPENAPPPVVLEVLKGGGVVLNKEPVLEQDIASRLPRIFAARHDHVLFFDAEDDVPYGRAMEILDLARAGGAITIAPLTERQPN